MSNRLSDVTPGTPTPCGGVPVVEGLGLRPDPVTERRPNPGENPKEPGPLAVASL